MPELLSPRPSQPFDDSSCMDVPIHVTTLSRDERIRHELCPNPVTTPTTAMRDRHTPHRDAGLSMVSAVARVGVPS